MDRRPTTSRSNLAIQLRISVRSVERGRRMPTILAASQLARALGSTLAEFIAEVESGQP